MTVNKSTITILFLFLVSVAIPSLPGMNLGYLYPAGGKQGETVELTAGGRGFGNIKAVFITGGGVELESAETVPGFGTPSPSQRDYLKRSIQAVIAGKALPAKPDDTSDWRRMHPYWEKLDQLSPLQFEMVLGDLYRPKDRLQMSPAISQRAIIRLRISPDAKTGTRELRLFNGRELSNPMPFQIGKAGEQNEPRYDLAPQKKSPPEFTPGTTLNGQILPGECDRFVFTAKRGETIGFDLYGRRLLPIIGDGVPGHFQPVLEIFGPDGRSAAFADDFYFDPDPLLNFRVPADGRYTVAVRDALYRGREDFVYRLHTGKGARRRAQEAFPKLELPRSDAAGVITIPAFVDGKIAVPGERDELRFTGSRGENVVLEIFARRCGSPLDSHLRLIGVNGETLAVNDDYPHVAVGPRLHDADSRLEYTLPADGEYRVEISDITGAGGDDYRYRLRIDHPRPDFRAWSVPSALTVSQDGDAEVLRVVVERLDGFAGELEFELESSGRFELCGATGLSSASSAGILTVRAGASRDRSPVRYRLYAKSGDLRRQVIPADEYIQAFATTHLICAREGWFVPAWKRFGGRLFSWGDGVSPVVRLEPGGRIELPVRVGKLEKAPRVEFDLGDLSATLKLEVPGEIVPESESRLILTAAPDAAPGSADLLLRVNYAFTRVEKDGRETRRTSVVTLPRLRIEIVPSTPEKRKKTPPKD